MEIGNNTIPADMVMAEGVPCRPRCLASIIDNSSDLIERLLAIHRATPQMPGTETFITTTQIDVSVTCLGKCGLFGACNAQIDAVLTSEADNPAFEQ
jgi:hypothetical protein